MSRHSFRLACGQRGNDRAHPCEALVASISNSEDTQTRSFLPQSATLRSGHLCMLVNRAFWSERIGALNGEKWDLITIPEPIAE